MSRRRLVSHCLLCMAVYAAAVAAWSPLGRIYANMFRSGANMVFGSFGPAGVVKFNRPTEQDRDIDTTAVLRKHGAPQQGQWPLSSRFLGYLPTAFVVALAVSTPLMWRRRVWLLLIALVLVHGFIAWRLWIGLYVNYCGPHTFCQFTPGKFWWTTASYLMDVSTKSISTSFLAPAIIWVISAALILRRADWSRIADAARGLTPAPPDKPKAAARKK